MTKIAKQEAAVRERSIERVRKVLGDHEPLWQAETLSAEQFAREGEHWGVSFGGGLWTSSLGNLNGIISGFCRTAPTAACLAARLGLVEKEDARIFTDWFSYEQQRLRDESEIDQARRLAEKHGFRLTKTRPVRTTVTKKKRRRRG